MNGLCAGSLVGMFKVFLNVLLFVFIFTFLRVSSLSFEIENTADNPRLVNITKQQLKDLANVEKRIYGNSFAFDNTVDRLERLELDIYESIQRGTPTQRLNNLKLESSRIALSGTAMTPMMQYTFNSKYINPSTEIHTYRDNVGIIDGLIRLWWPDFYSTLSEYRKFKETEFY